VTRPGSSQAVTAAFPALLGLLVAAFFQACVPRAGEVTRMADGVRYEGRFVNPEAYAAYLLGVEREAHGNLAGALAAYLEAHAADPDSPEIWARIGAVRCFASEPTQGLPRASAAFERGIRTDADYFGTYFERARCAERAGQLGSALLDASAAVFHRPSDEPANLLVASLLQALGRPGEARAWLEGFQAFQGPTRAVSRALDKARGQPARPAQRLLETPSRSEAFVELHSGRAERARARGQTELEADPTNSDAWVATLVACDALGDEACFERALGSLKTPSQAPSQTALGYLQQLISRRAGASPAF